MIDVKIIKKAKQGHVSVGGGIATAGNNYTTGIQQTLADVLNFNAGLTRLLKPYDANNQPLTWAQATDPDGDGGIKAKTLRAAVTFASVGDIVAYQNGNLSGGTGGGGLDITALEDYLTTNGYATQAWVSAHFNDYVLTKAAVEAVLTGNITTHTHNQYLTEHQSLANYYTKAEVDTALGGYVTLKTAQTISGDKTFSGVVVVQGGVRILYANQRGYLQLGNTDNKQGEISAWSGVPLENLILNTAKAEVRGAVTANQFIRTGGTATQFLKADGSVDSNTYLTTGAASDTYLPKLAYTAADILTKIKTVDGAGSGLDADTLDGVHGKGYMYYNAYNFANGCLVRLKLLASGRDMVTVHIKGNSFHVAFPFDTWVQFYHFKQDDAILAVGAIHNGYNFGNINVFCYDGHVYLWFKQTLNYQSFSVYAECTNEYYVGNLVEDITNAAMPTEGVTRLKTIVPKQSALITDNVASATKLQTARTINGTAFDGTAAITTAKWGTARNLTIGNTAKSVDGSSAMAWSLAEIGALGVNANAVSASKLQTAHTLWGQSFDGTDNVAGTLSGVENIIFNANAKIAATDNHLRLLTKSGGAQGLAAVQLLASDSYADWAKVPANGIYSKGDIVTDGTIKIGGGTITWDAGNNAFMFSHTVASQGDMVAFQNGNLSGGTGGGGLDITALESYLTTNGYATQAWVSAHFNDYVLTKAAVEAVLTGNITTHTHNQYLTEHQSLANYYTKTESDGKYLTAITKSMVEAVLTGNITSHTHSQYLTQHQSLANYMTRGEIGDTYQAKSTALSFSAASGYVAARFTDAALATSAAQNYIELWGKDGWFNLQAGHLLAHGAVTATSFVKTGGTATQFLKADGSVDSNSYLLSSAYTAADILTKIKTVDGSGSGLDADLLDGVQGSSYLYATCHCGEQKTGVLVKTDVPKQDRAMFTVHINGNTYNGFIPIDTYIQFYNFNNSEIIRWTAINNGYNFGAINVFIYEGYVCLWFPQPQMFMSFNIFVSYTNSPALRYNRVISVTNTTMPTEGVTRLVTITPYQSALTTDNVASATKLQTARAINGTAFDGTAAITTAKWGTARNLTIGNTAKSVDGSSAMAWSLAEIGALGVNANAVSASKLQTAHTLWGQSFDGTNNISGALSAVTTIDMTGDILQGDVRYGRNSGMYAEIRSGGNELVISGKGTATDMYVNYRASGFSDGTVPSVWRWMAGSGSEWASHEIGGLTTHGEVKLPYIGSTYLSMATRENVIKGALNNSATNAHALLRIMNSNGAAWVVGGTGKDVGIYGFTNERITNNDENAPSWETTWDADTGELSHSGAMNVQSLKIGGGTITWDADSNSFIFSHTIASQGNVVAFKE